MKFFWALLLGMFSVNVLAEQLSVDYKSFYIHVRKLDDEDTQALQFAFGFLHVQEQRLCKIESAMITTQKQNLPLEVSLENRFTVPVDKILKLAKAKVVIDLQDQANQCDMSVQIETKAKYLKRIYTQQELLFLFNQYETFFADMGGFLSFMMPIATGLTFYFHQPPANGHNRSGLAPKNNKLVLSKAWIEANNELLLDHTPFRITAVTSK